MTETTRFTVFGASGRIGSAMAAHLRSLGHDCLTPARDEQVTGWLGHGIYAIGVTADFRTRPIDTIRAHVCRLVEVLETATFDSLVYLSSTRVYRGLDRGVEEATLRIDPTDTDDLYAASKLAAESLLCTIGPRVHIVRLSNVVGSGATSNDFLPTIARDAVRRGRVELVTALDSRKDYVALTDVVELLTRIALSGRERIYNVASGTLITHGEICAKLQELTGCKIDVSSDAPAVTFPPVSIERVTEAFGFTPRPPLDEISALVDEIRRGGRV